MPKTIKRRFAPAQTLGGALVVSMLIHLTLFGGWHLGKKLGWWQNRDLPRWMRLFPSSTLAKIEPRELERQLAQAQALQREIPLVFVDVDPAQATVEPPKETPYYGMVNSKAANVQKDRDSTKPKVDGTQKDLVKITDPGKTLAPAPPTPAPEEAPKEEVKTPEPTQAEAAKPAPAPTPPKKATVVKTETPVKSVPADKTVAPGDLAFAKPQEAGNPKVSAPASSASQKKTRPRTLNEKRGFTGERMVQSGGVNNLASVAGLDVRSSITGDYDARFINAVQQSWDAALAENKVALNGRVVLHFRLHYDGRISAMEVRSNSTGNPLAPLYCMKGVEDPAPFPKWPAEMRRQLGSDVRDLTFTFIYGSR